VGGHFTRSMAGLASSRGRLFYQDRRFCPMEVTSAEQEIFAEPGNFFGDDLVYTGKTTRGVGG